jgi:uncharacterized coiled-coil DUF342 family protein
MNTLKEDIDNLFKRADGLNGKTLEAFMQEIVEIFDRLQTCSKEKPEEAREAGTYLQTKLEARAEQLYAKMAAGDK